MFERHL